VQFVLCQNASTHGTEKFEMHTAWHMARLPL
jgi:hypothetical protein